MDKWTQFNHHTRNNPPRKLYLDALKFMVSEDVYALDIAAGAGNETKDMLSRGFSVVSFDSNPDILKVAQKLRSDTLETEISTMEKYEYGKNRFDFIIAMFALPFIKPENFHSIHSRIIESLNTGGIFAFHLFGNNDEWASKKNMTFHTTESAKELFHNNEQLLFQDYEYDGKTADGSKKHWHVISCILKKSDS